MRLRAHSSTETNHGLAFDLPDGFVLPEHPRLSDYPREHLRDTWYECCLCHFRHCDNDKDEYGNLKTRFVYGKSEPVKFACLACVRAKRKEIRESAAQLHAPGMGDRK